MAFLVICVGITILQMSKVDPTTLSKLDRRSTILLQASRSRTEVEEKSISGVEDPGMDALRGSFGTVGSIIRARSARRMSQSSNAPSARTRRVYDAEGVPYSIDRITTGPDALKGMTRHQLWDAPMPPLPPLPNEQSTPKPLASPSLHSSSPESVRRTTIKFDSTELVHQYPRPGAGDAAATHEHRDVARGGYPPSTSKTSLPDAQGGDDGTDTLRQMTTSPTQLDITSSSASIYRPERGDRSDARHVFSSDSIDSTTELMSLPSGSDEQPPWDTPPVPAKSPRFARAYPKGEDDNEESVRLFNRNLLPVESPSDESSTGGIRLVPPSGKF
jgi:magnesium transporter